MKLTDESHDPEWMGGPFGLAMEKSHGRRRGRGEGEVGITDKEKFDLVSRAYTNFTQD